ncbi:unnamed protein product [Calicophoron daubneyi]|uniref:Stathmin n=1 Tax=Calicophoron daubneyi TaxID=300641 RepID=A0AAV2TVG2_CALDB
MGCNVSKNEVELNETKKSEEKINDSGVEGGSKGKNSISFEISLDKCNTVGDTRGNLCETRKSELRKPTRLAPIQNPPVITNEMIDEKLKRAEEKREQLLAARRISCQKPRQAPPSLLMQGRSIPIAKSAEKKKTNTPSSWTMNWSGDENLTDEQLDAILQAEEEGQAENERNFEEELLLSDPREF